MSTFQAGTHSRSTTCFQDDPCWVFENATTRSIVHATGKQSALAEQVEQELGQRTAWWLVVDPFAFQRREYGIRRLVLGSREFPQHAAALHR